MVQRGLSTVTACLLTSRGFNNTDTTEHSDQDLQGPRVHLQHFPCGALLSDAPPDLPLLFSQPLPRAPSPPRAAWVLLLRWFGNVSPDTSQGTWEIPLICLLSACPPMSGKSISFTSCFSVIHREKVNLLPPWNEMGISYMVLPIGNKVTRIYYKLLHISCL